MFLDSRVDLHGNEYVDAAVLTGLQNVADGLNATAGDDKVGNPTINNHNAPETVIGCENNNTDIMVFSTYGGGFA